MVFGRTQNQALTDPASGSTSGNVAQQLLCLQSLFILYLVGSLPPHLVHIISCPTSTRTQVYVPSPLWIRTLSLTSDSSRPVFKKNYGPGCVISSNPRLHTHFATNPGLSSPQLHLIFGPYRESR